MDRIDRHVEDPAVKYEGVTGQPDGEPSSKCDRAWQEPRSG